MVKFEGKFGTSATVICDSISAAGVRLLTFEITYWRGVLAELNTHRMLSKSSASSRAIPFKKMQDNLTGRPVRFGEANAGMQDKGGEYDAEIGGYTPQQWWGLAKLSAQRFSDEFHEAGYAKQVYNRLTEPFQMMKTVISGTEWDNFFWLRDDAAADPTIAELARCMREAKDHSTPERLRAGEYHLPYVESSRDAAGKQHFWHYITKTEKLPLKLEDAIKVSCARSAAVSFRNVDYGLEKCKEVYERLVGDERKHASALEHQATPMRWASRDPATWQEGVSHVDKTGQLWSGNFRGFVQHRKTVDGENYTDY